VAIVAGGSRGIGRATAEALVAAGARVVLTSRTQAGADDGAAAIGEGAVGFAAHAVDEAAARSCVAFALERHGRVDILVNNAGTNPAFGPVIDQDHARYAKVFDVNVWAPIMWTNLVWQAWMAEHGGAIVNTASLGGLAAEPNLGMYGASKAALIHLTRNLALELAPRVRVNAVAPGVVRTKLSEALWKDHEDVVVNDTPLRRIGEPEDVAGAIVFLASDAAAWITGETLVLDGGQSLRAVATGAGRGA
jgi:NAD(P)-dependent dehydrogenase (short-subunit alcohol dehydrogenase family)